MAKAGFYEDEISIFMNTLHSPSGKSARLLIVF
jgi:hypothetical protein